MPWLPVQCPNEECSGREVCHTTDCRCRGTERVHGEDPHSYEECPEEPTVIPARWQALYVPGNREAPGDFDNTIYCSACGEEGEAADE